MPNTILTGINPRWQQNAQKLAVREKKEIFYRLMLPLAVHANGMVRERRAELQRLDETLASGKQLSTAEQAHLANVLEVLRIASVDATAAKSSAELRTDIAEALYRLDEIPAGLVLGQAAYESGYGTSRFAVEGNALFGQWTYNGSGMRPA